MKGAVIFLDPRGTALEVVRAAKRHGYRTVALVSDPNLVTDVAPPYQEAARAIDHVTVVPSWSELSVTSICEERIDGVYFSLDACAIAGSRLRKDVGLPHTDPDVMGAVIDKYRLRKKLRETGLSHLSSISDEEAEELLAWPFAGAAYFKPVHGCYSAYVERCESLSDLQRAKELWRRRNAGDPLWVKNYLDTQGAHYHVEEAIDGELLSVEAISSSGKFHSLGLLSRILYSKNPVVEMGSCFPYPHPEAERIVETVRRAHEVLGIREGATHTEVIVSKDGRIEIIDLNPRFVGADVLQSVNNALKIRAEETLLDWALGETVRIDCEPKAYACLQYVLPPEPLTFDSIDFPKTPDVVFTSTLSKKGKSVSSTDRQMDYLGCYLTLAPAFDQALARSRELRDAVLINGNKRGAY